MDAAQAADLSGDDPHFWLDPTKLSQVAAAFEEQLAAADPAHRAAYARNLAGLQSDLATLDRDFRTGLAHCAISTIVVSHDAFGYLGRRYGLEVVGINGLSPDAEPSPAHIRELQDLIRSDRITTVFSERLGSPKFADSLAGDLGIRAAVLDPDRGPERRDGGPGLPVPDAVEPGRPREGEHLLMSTPAVTVTDGAVELGGRPVLRGIDLSVGTGEVVAVLGANGSGKSTLVRTMMGLVPTCRGEVRLFGTPLDDFQDWQRVGFVPQRTSAASGVPASVREVVASGRLSRRRPFVPQRRADREAVESAIAAVGLTGKARDGVSTLSGGQQQRVLIARALAGVPDLLVLDEPTAGVDVQSQQTFADALRTLVVRGATIVLVAHELGPLGDLVDRALVMRDGRVAYDGPPIAAFTDADTTHDHHHVDLDRRPATTRRPWPRRWTGREDADEPAQLRLHGPGAARRPVHRARRPGGRHLPRAAPAGADG